MGLGLAFKENGLRSPSVKPAAESRAWGDHGCPPSLTYTQLLVREDKNNGIHHPEIKPDLDLMRDQNMEAQRPWRSRAQAAGVAQPGSGPRPHSGREGTGWAELQLGHISHSCVFEP